MKKTVYIGILALLFSSTSCSKKQETVQLPTNDASVSVETDIAEPGIVPSSAEQDLPAPTKSTFVDFTNRKPFKFTVTADIKAKDICYYGYVDENYENVYDCEEGEDPDEVKILVAIHDVGGKYPIQYDLDCESDGTYEFTGLTSPHAYCIYKNHSGKHQISVRGNIPAMMLCARKGDIRFGEDDYSYYVGNDEYLSMIPPRDDVPHYANDNEFGQINKELPDYFYSEPVNSIDDWGDIEWKSMVAFAAGCENLESIPENPPNLKDVTDMRYTFREAKSFNQPLDKWDVSSVTDMSGMFNGAESFNQTVDNWDVSNVIGMKKMFAHAKSFNQPIEKWNVSSVTDMSGMFWDAQSFNQPLEAWDVSHVTDMSGMFVLAKSFKQSLKKWGVSKINDYSNRKPFKFTITTNNIPGMDESEDEDKPKKKSSNKVKVLVAIDDVNGNYPVQYDLDCDSDGRYEFTGLTTLEHYCTYKANTGNHQISVRGDIPAMILCERRCNRSDWDVSLDDHRRILPARDDIECSTDREEPVITVDDWGDIEWKSMLSFASDCQILKSIPEQAPNLKKVTDMRYMFAGTKSFNQPLESWDVSNVTNMKFMFAGAISFNQPLESLNVSNVKDMRYMFYAAKSFNQPLEKWDVSNVRDMACMFHYAESFNQPLNHWNVASVTDMCMMFNNATLFNQPLESWDVSNVTNMHWMFAAAKSFNQPLDKWNLSNVEKMSGMFWGASSYSYYPQDWVIPEKESSEEIFRDTLVEKQAKQNPLKTRKPAECL